MTQSSPSRILSIDSHATIDVIAESEFPPAKHSKPAPTSSFQENSEPSSALVVSTSGNFASVLAPLTPEKFSQVVNDVEQRLRIVNQTLGMLNTNFDVILDEMLQAIRGKVGELLSADRTTIFLLDSDKNQLWTNVPSEDGKSIEIRISTEPTSIAGEVATYRKTVNIPFDFFDDPRSSQAKKQFERTGYRTYSMLAMPLLNDNDQLVAVVQLINKLRISDSSIPIEKRVDKVGFTEEDQALFAQFVPSMRLILESSQAFYSAAQKQRAADALMKAAMSLGQSLDLETTLKKVMDEAKLLMNADRSTLWLIDRDRNDLWTQIVNHDGTTKELRVPMGIGYVGRVAITGEVLNIPFDLYEHSDADNSKKFDQANGYRTCSLLCMPIFNFNKELIGVTQLVNKLQRGDFPEYDPITWPVAPDLFKASFNNNDEEFMKVFNVQAGVALENAKLFAKVKQEQQMQKDILRSLSDGVISTDKHGKIIAANERAYELLGVGNTSLEGRSVYELIDIETANFTKWFENSLAGNDDKSRKQYYPDQTLRSTDGEQHSINISINTMSEGDEGGSVRGALVVMEDISQEKRLKSTMYRYMTQELAEQLLAGGDAKMGGEHKEVSVLFSDIRSYTTITESLAAEDVVLMLNEYFETMVEAVFNYKGTLDKYIGDAIMAVFGSPLPIPDHAWMAVQTAIDMRHRLKEFNVKRIEKLKPKTLKEIDMATIKIGIGINSDTVISGNIGSTRRMEFTAIGDGVNLGSRLEGASKQYGTDAIISESTYKLCGDRIWVRELDRIQVKGKNQPVNVYELIGLKSDPLSENQTRIIEHYHAGRKYYLTRKFSKAIAEFAEVLELDKDNKAANIHITRCQHFLLNAPEDNWDGVWKLTEK
ncbi:MAG: GAF domain-containing protein [Pseudanabaena sp.]|jgi:adenylate cyclase|nr:GAF domain-containing protein [Pseudanabaena sp. M53BS1SP1A06MG]MCA6581173.1 GAF domain-containing protein [Pseudanabaena sp. M34BS1SP1A06MG]MCA6589901.1 GAF domain-containing protein [Pseudanabaena sp. M109S1SP1A06QC]MCA6591554.1 GAF domain-containing protein [Pseudanabaena sp. M38BS1SP1A06MG]MCA6596695.1 GAF domain-containing protein [Pseudanabaena sp. M046S1SP1A06QC]MCA6599446.1 GAF domain-containing protein [Pseudanabaena sp. M57BS1SP1A06MG]MCA6603030.1 GAF domain-containing protein [P